MKKLKEYQREGVEALKKILRKNYGAILADDMGLGKTLQAIQVMIDAKQDRYLVACPASMCGTWKAALDEQWPPRQKAHIRICSYNRLSNLVDWYRRWNPDIIVADESHNLNGENTQRSLAFFSIPTKRYLFLSATPINNRVSELYNCLSACLDIGGRIDFGIKFCGGKLRWVTKTKQVWDFSGSSNEAELNRLVASVTVRRKKTEVEKELPAKTRSIVYIEATSKFSRLDKEAVALWRSRIKGLSFEEQIRLMEPERFPELMRLRRELGEEKSEQALDYVENMLKCENKVAVFAWHLGVIDGFIKAFPGCATLYGATKNPAAEVEKFQKGTCRLLIGQTRVAGVGHTLTAASHAVVVEPVFTPAGMEQQEDRLHRIGTPRPVFIHYLVVPGSLDEVLLKMCLRKKEVIQRIFE